MLHTTIVRLLRAGMLIMLRSSRKSLSGPEISRKAGVTGIRTMASGRLAPRLPARPPATAGHNVPARYWVEIIRLTADSRLISPTIDLVGEYEVIGGEELRLRFRHWFSYYYGDAGYVQISEYDEATESWSAFTSHQRCHSLFFSSLVVQQSIDITAYAGKKVRIAFLHSTYDYNSEVAAGWYVDHVEIIKKEPEWTGDFECGWGDWYTDNGVWEVGTPTSGPALLLQRDTMCRHGIGWELSVLRGQPADQPFILSACGRGAFLLLQALVLILLRRCRIRADIRVR